MKVSIGGGGLVGSCAAFALQNGCYGLRDVALSVPTVVGRGGATATHQIELWPKELQGLRTSAGVLRETLDAVLAQR